MQVCISFAEFVHTPFRKRKKIYLIRKAGYLGNYAAGWLAVYRYGKQISQVVFISVLHLESLFCWRERGG